MRIYSSNCAALLLTLCGIVGAGSCGRDEYREPEKRFSPMSSEEKRVHELIVTHIDAAEALLNDDRLSGSQREQLQKSVARTRYRLDEFIDKRSQGHTQATVMMSLGSAGTAVVSNDVTGVGLADDWLLLPLALAAIGSHIILESPASRNEIQSAWYDVGKGMKALGKDVEIVGQAISQSATIQAGAKPRPRIPPVRRLKPGGKERTTIDISPLEALPIPKTKEKPRKRREECIPKRVCPHLGFDDWHDYCADQVLGNEFPTCDVMVNGKRFDAKVGNKLYEVKTDDWDTYSEFLVNRTLEDHATLAKLEKMLANVCGYDYEFVVGDATLKKELSQRLAPLDLVRYEPKCNRKAFKAGSKKP